MIRTELLILRFGSHGSVDIGARCYLDRACSKNTVRFDHRTVELASLCSNRVQLLGQLVHYILEIFESGNLRPSTVRTIANSWMRFIDWCDKNSHRDAFNQPASTKIAFRAYVENLRLRIEQEHLATITGHRYQQDALVFCEDFLEVENVSSGVRLIRSLKSPDQGTEVPDEDAQARVLALCDSLFWSLSRLVIEHRPYPARIDVPPSLGWSQPYLWAFPGAPWALPPHVLAKRETLRQATWAFDYQNGRIASFDEIKGRYPHDGTTRMSISRAHELIENANADKYHRARLRAAAQAHKAFAMLFVANTGMNWAQVSNLRWSGDYKSEKDGLGFRVIKYRARNKFVHFRIGVKFSKAFRQFLLLRDYQLRTDETSEYLFFQQGHRQQFAPYKLSWTVLSRFYELLDMIDPGIPRILTRQWRVARLDWQIRNSDISTTAELFQNSETTVAKSYASGSSPVATAEMTDYFDKLSEQVKSSRKRRSTARDNALGTCNDFGNPVSVYDQHFQADCRQSEGCLFCAKFAVHADEVDLRKLFSCQFCVEKTAHFSNSVEHHESVFGEVTRRISRLIEEISGRSTRLKQIAEDVEKDVYENGNLSPYWSRKLDMLIHLGLVSV